MCRNAASPLLTAGLDCGTGVDDARHSAWTDHAADVMTAVISIVGSIVSGIRDESLPITVKVATTSAATLKLAITWILHRLFKVTGNPLADVYHNL